MKEHVVLSCDMTLADVTLFMKRSGRYIDAGYVLDSFKSDTHLKAIFTTKNDNPMGFQSAEEEKTE